MNVIIIKTQAAAIKTVPRSGKPTLHFNEQQAALDNGSDFPVPFTVTLKDGAQPYAPGRYICTDYAVGDYGRISAPRTMDLIPLSSTLEATLKSAGGK